MNGIFFLALGEKVCDFCVKRNCKEEMIDLGNDRIFRVIKKPNVMNIWRTVTD